MRTLARVTGPAPPPRGRLLVTSQAPSSRTPDHPKRAPSQPGTGPQQGQGPSRDRAPAGTRPQQGQGPSRDRAPAGTGPQQGQGPSRDKAPAGTRPQQGQGLSRDRASAGTRPQQGQGELTLQPPLAPQLQLLLLGQNSLGLGTCGQRTRGEQDKARSPRCAHRCSYSGCPAIAPGRGCGTPGPPGRAAAHRAERLQPAPLAGP